MSADPARTGAGAGQAGAGVRRAVLALLARGTRGRLRRRGRRPRAAPLRRERGIVALARLRGLLLPLRAADGAARLGAPGRPDDLAGRDEGAGAAPARAGPLAGREPRRPGCVGRRLRVVRRGRVRVRGAQPLRRRRLRPARGDAQRSGPLPAAGRDEPLPRGQPGPGRRGRAAALDGAGPSLRAGVPAAQRPDRSARRDRGHRARPRRAALRPRRAAARATSGKSYGTYLGASYAAAYPQHVGRMVLDGAVDPGLSTTAFALAQAAATERELTAFVRACVDRGVCSLGDLGAAGHGPDPPVPRRAGRRAAPGRRPAGLAERGAVRDHLRPGRAGRLGDAGDRADLRSRGGRPGDGLAGEPVPQPGDGRSPARQLLGGQPGRVLPRPRRRPVTAGRRASAAEALRGGRPHLRRVVRVAGGGVLGVAGPHRSAAPPARRGRHPSGARGGDDGRPVDTTGVRAGADRAAGPQRAAAPARSRPHRRTRMGNECVDRAVDRYLVDGAMPESGTVC